MTRQVLLYYLEKKIEIPRPTRFLTWLHFISEFCLKYANVCLELAFSCRYARPLWS